MTMPGIPGQVPESAIAALSRKVAQLQRQVTQLEATAARLAGGLHLGQLPGAGDVDPARWPATTSSSWAPVWAAMWELQNPALTWLAQIYTPAGTVAQFRLRYGGTVLGTSAKLTGGPDGLTGTFAGTAVALPGDGGTEQLLTVDARVLSGPGDARFNWLQLKGDQS